MEPALHEGDIVLVESVQSVAVGDVVVAIHPTRRQLRLVKRVESVDAEGVIVMSDNRAEMNATDSRTFGPVPLSDIEGRVSSLLRR
ncbi:MAG: S26 family signal peptidase [Acidimicrobiales bacterium]|nr:S26 family signal peptidase [Acidimicrobiales bacterium]